MRHISKNDANVTLHMVGPAGKAETISPGRLRKWLRVVAGRVRQWAERRKSRRALSRLTDTELRDIGITRNQAREEYRKSLYID